MTRLRTIPVVVLMCAAALVGCSNDNTKKADSSPSSGTSSSTSSSSQSSSPSDGGTTGSPSPTEPPINAGEPKFPRDRIEAASMHIAYLDSSVAKTSDEKDVVNAWMSFWQGAADTYYLYKPTNQFLGVARDSAKSDILNYMQDLKSKHHRVVGWAKDNVTKVSIDGDNATVRDCTQNFTYTVDSEIEPLTRPTLWYDVTGVLKKEDGQWTVTSQTSKDLTKSCLS